MDRKQMRERIVAGLLGEEEKKLQHIEPLRGSIIPITNFDKLWSKVDRIDAASSDLIVPRKGLVISDIGENLGLETVGIQLPLSNWSLNQICETTDVPASYIKKMMAADEFKFAATNLNRWLEDLPEDKEYLLRTTSNRLHGFLTDRYSIFDDKEVLDVTQSALTSLGSKWHVTDYMATPELMNFRIAADEQININGEDLSVAYKVWNSRVGASSLEVEFFIYKWMCSNGMIFGGGKASVVAQRHVKINKDTWAAKLDEIIARTPRMVEYVKEAVEASRVNALSDEALEFLLNEFRETANASKSSLVMIKDRMERFGGNTVWGLANAMTEVAQEYSVDTRERFERYAGQLVERRIAA